MRLTVRHNENSGKWDVFFRWYSNEGPGTLVRSCFSAEEAESAILTSFEFVDVVVEADKRYRLTPAEMVRQDVP